MSQVPQHLIEEARKRGIVPGATIKTAWPKASNRQATVPPESEWRYEYKKDLFFRVGGDDCWIYDLESSYWATVITPAPSEPEGLKEGDSVECGPAMRAAIIEMAKELGLPGYVPPSNQTKPCWYEGRLQHIENMDYVDPHGITFKKNTPEAFIAKMRVTAALPKPEPPIKIGSHEVEFRSGSIKVGRTTVDNATVRAIAEKLIDR